MKKLFLVLAILAMAMTANAWTINWGAAVGADGYSVYWKALTDTDYIKVDVGTALGYDLEPLSLVTGTRYEFYITCHSNGSESDESDHIRWTMPSPPVIVEMPEPPKQLIINF